MNTKTTLALIGAALVVAPTAVFAALGVGDPVGTTEADIRAELEKQGYVIEEIEIEGDEIEVEATLDGQALEFEVDPATGAIIEMELADADDDEDDDDDGDEEMEMTPNKG